MNIVLNPFGIPSESISLVRIMQDLTNYSFGGKIINELVYNIEFMTLWLNSLNELFPDLWFYGNSFIQLESLKRFEGEIYIVEDCSSINEYHTGNQYHSTYVLLKKEKMSNIHLNAGIESESEVDYYNVLCILLILWRNIHMGEITDAITAAINNVQNSANTPVDTDEVKQVMSNLGMPVEGYKKQNKVSPKKEVTKSVQTQHKQKFDKIMNPPEEKEESTDSPTEICCKINNGRLVLMIPHGAKLNSVEVAGMTFDTLTVDVPDIESHKLQLLNIYGQVEDVKTSQVDKIVRVPIIFTDEERKQWNAEINTNTEKKTVIRTNAKEDSDELSELKHQKSELDEKIKEARTAGDEDSVKTLRKQRRKLRDMINKLEV